MSLQDSKEQLTLSIARPIAILRSPIPSANDPCSCVWPDTPDSTVLSDVADSIRGIVDSSFDLLLSIIPEGFIDLKQLPIRVALSASGNPVPLAELINNLVSAVQGITDLITTVTQAVTSTAQFILQIQSDPLGAIQRVAQWLSDLSGYQGSALQRLIAAIATVLEPQLNSVLLLIDTITYYTSLNAILYGQEWINSQINMMLNNLIFAGTQLINKFIDILSMSIIPVTIIKDLIQYCIDNLTIPIPTIDMVMTLIGDRLKGFVDIDGIQSTLGIAQDAVCVTTLAALQISQVGVLIPRMMLEVSGAILLIPINLLGLS